MKMKMKMKVMSFIKKGGHNKNKFRITNVSKRYNTYYFRVKFLNGKYIQDINLIIL